MHGYRLHRQTLLDFFNWMWRWCCGEGTVFRVAGVDMSLSSGCYPWSATRPWSRLQTVTTVATIFCQVLVEIVARGDGRPDRRDGRPLQEGWQELYGIHVEVKVQ